MSDARPDGDRAPEPGPDEGPAAPEQAAGASRAAAGPVPPPPSSPAAQRLSRFTAANMLRSLLPLTVIILLLGGFAALRQNNVDPVTPVETATTVRFAASTAGYQLEAPADLPEGWTATSARTDAGSATGPDDAVTLELGFYTPGEEFAGFVTSDDPRVTPLRSVLDGASDDGTARIGGQSWTRLTTARGETAFTRESGGATVLVTGSAADRELETLAASIRRYPTT